jgi:hypothetical protein
VQAQMLGRKIKRKNANRVDGMSTLPTSIVSTLLTCVDKLLRMLDNSARSTGTGTEMLSKLSNSPAVYWLCHA